MAVAMACTWILCWPFPIEGDNHSEAVFTQFHKAHHGSKKYNSDMPNLQPQQRAHFENLLWERELNRMAWQGGVYEEIDYFSQLKTAYGGGDKAMEKYLPKITVGGGWKNLAGLRASCYLFYYNYKFKTFIA